MMSGRNIFLTGNAGTGKTTILREFRKRCGKECVFLAPTGIAAINVQGTTIHSFLLLKPGLLMPDMIEDNRQPEAREPDTRHQDHRHRRSLHGA